MLVEYKLFEPAFYHTDLADWGTSFAVCLRLGERAKVLVDTGHHGHYTNIEYIVAQLLAEERLGGFHFNDRRYADDDLIVGSANPYALFTIFHELINNHDGVSAAPVAYMLDQAHVVEKKIEAMVSLGSQRPDGVCQSPSRRPGSPGEEAARRRRPRGARDSARRLRNRRPAHSRRKPARRSDAPPTRSPPSPPTKSSESAASSARSTRPAPAAEVLARRMDAEIVPENFVSEQPWPIDLKSVATQLLRERSEDDEKATDTEAYMLPLIAAFGDGNIGDENHRRATLVCCMAARQVLWGWAAMDCDGNLPEENLKKIESWIFGEEADLKSATVPVKATRNGRIIMDCDTCRVEPIAGTVASAALYALTRKPEDGADALLDVLYAMSEGIEKDDSLDFDSWLVMVALPAAWELRLLTEVEEGPEERADLSPGTQALFS